MTQHLEERQTIADFVGWNRRLHKALGGGEGPRGALLRWTKEDIIREKKKEDALYPDLHIGQNVPGKEGMKGQGTSLFCFIPRGSATTKIAFK